MPPVGTARLTSSPHPAMMDTMSFRYPGGKGKCFQRLINLMPPHRTYIETHLGGGAVMRHKLPAQRSIGIDADPALIARWQREHPQICELVHADAVSYLESFHFTGDELVYADPPYVASSRRRQRIYRYEYELTDHEALLEALLRAPCKVMISGYDNALYRQALRGWACETFTAKTHQGVCIEQVWMNFAPPSVLHDSRYLGMTYRQREAIRRVRMRWIARLTRMPAAERNALLDALNVHFAASAEHHA
jgi:site-specific DNA-adenine methylase